MSKASKLQQWIDYIQRLHYREIDLSLDRVAAVYQQMHPEGVKYRVVTVAGTNGKGSTAEIIASSLRAAGYLTAKYTSPHLVRFNERYQIGGVEVADTELLKAFSRVEVSRGQVPLTFFEYGTLIAIELFARAQVDIAVMEVGLGGRLDAVNILDADVSVLTSVSIDHSHWLGDSLEQIGGEKIAIARPHKPCVISMQDPPNSVIEYCQQNNVKVARAGKEYQYQINPNGTAWEWQRGNDHFENLPLPYGQRGCQVSNAAAAIMACRLLPNAPVDQASFRKGLLNARARARCELVAQNPHIVLDVAHNEASMVRLAEYLESLNIQGRIVALCGMLADKEIAKSLAHLVRWVDEWHLATIHEDRGATARQVRDHLTRARAASSYVRTADPAHCHEDVRQAFQLLKNELDEADCLLVFGSFYIVGDIIPLT